MKNIKAIIIYIQAVLYGVSVYAAEFGIGMFMELKGQTGYYGINPLTASVLGISLLLSILLMVKFYPAMTKKQLTVAAIIAKIGVIPLYFMVYLMTVLRGIIVIFIICATIEGDDTLDWEVLSLLLESYGEGMFMAAGSAVFSIAYCIRVYKEGLCTLGKCILMGILQFLPGIDIISGLAFSVSVDKKSREKARQQWTRL